MSGPESSCPSRVASLEVHSSYLRRDADYLSRRVGSLESSSRRHESLSRDVSELQGRLRQVEEAIRLVKLAAGLLMMAVAYSGVLGGSAEKLARLVGGALLGVP